MQIQLLLTGLITTAIITLLLLNTQGKIEFIEKLTIEYEEAQQFALLLNEIKNSPANLTLRHELNYIKEFEIKNNILTVNSLKITIPEGIKSTATTNRIIITKQENGVEIKDV